MKKYILWAILAMILPITQAWGGSSYYAKAHVKVGTGSGTVYISNASSATSGATDIADKNTNYKTSSSGGSVNAYFYAIPASGSKFVGWTKDGKSLGMGDEGGTNNRLTQSLTASGTSDGTLDNGTWVANFAIKENYSITYKCSGGTYKAGSETINADTTFQKDDNYTVTFSEPSESPGYEFVGWCRWHDNGATEILSYKKTFNMTFTETIKFGAYFREVVPIKLTIAVPEGGSCTYKVGSGNAVSMTSESDDASVNGYGTVSISFTATPADKSMRAKWYHVSETGIKTYFSCRGTASYDFTSSGTIGVEFEQVNSVLAAAIEEAKANDTHTAVLTDDASVFDGTEGEIPSGVTIDLGGHTLFVDGKLTVSGTVNNGTVSKCGKLLRQYGVGLEPYNPYSTVKYWRTVQETPAADATASATHVTLIDGLGNAYRKVYTTEPKYVKCTLGSIGRNMFGTILSLSDSASITTRPEDSEMYVALVDVSLDGPIERESNKYDRLNFYSQKIDLAGKTCTSPADQYSSNHKPQIFNGYVSFDPGSYAQNSGGTFYNCSSITIKDIKNCCYLWLYDCETGLTLSNNENGYLAANFYSGKYTYTFGSFTETKSSVLQTKIYGGAFQTKPDDKYLADSSNYAFYQHDDGYWYVEPKQEPYVATVTCGSAAAEKVYYLTDAFDKLNTSDNVSVMMLRSVKVDAQQTVPAGKKLTLELNGCRITAPNGFVKNYGTVEISDQNERSSGSGIYSSGANVFENEVGGSIDICYGEYVGNIVVNGGSFTTHQGTFRGGTITKGDSADINLRGGSFDYDVGAAGLMDEGYIATPLRDGGKWWVGVYPWAQVKKEGVGSYTLTAMTSADLADYRNGKTSKSQYDSVAAWKSHAELVSSRAAFVNVEYIDFLIELDCDAEVGTIETKYDYSDEKLFANTPVRFLSPRITGTQISYVRFMYDSEHKYDKLSAWAESPQHKGATCTLYMEIWRYKERHSTIMVPLLTIAKERFVFGMASDDMAMIVGGNDVTFKKSLAAAVSDVTDGGTVRLCQSCAGESFTVTKPCTIDLNGFSVGEIVAGQGLQKTPVTSAAGTTCYVFAASERKVTVQVPDHTTLGTVTADDVVITADAGGMYTVKDGAKVVVTYTADEGYEVSAVTNVVTKDGALDAPTVTAIEYAITYEPQGADFGGLPTTYTINDNVSLATPALAGHDFAGWYADSGFTQPIGDVAIAEGGMGPRTFYAKFTPAGYILNVPEVAHATVSVRVGENEIGTMAGKYVVAYGSEVFVTYQAWPGYDFDGQPSAIVNHTVTGDATLDSPKTDIGATTYVITYELDGGAENENPNPTTYTIETEDVILNDPTRPEYNFVGWFVDAEKTQAVGDVAIKKGSTGDKTFYAKWVHVPMMVNVTLNDHVLVESVVADGKMVKATSAGVYSVPYEAEVIVTYKAAAGYQIADADRVVTVEKIQLDAHLEVPEATTIDYTINYELYDGEKSDGVYPTGYTVESGDITIPALTKTGYDFAGWYEDEKFAKKTGTVTIPQGSTGDKTLYAAWYSQKAEDVKMVEANDVVGKTNAVFEVKVPERWVESVEQAGTTTVQEELEKVAENGLTVWQNFALDEAGAAASTRVEEPAPAAKASEVTISVDTPATSETASMKVTRVGIAKITIDANGQKSIDKAAENTTVTTDGGKTSIAVDFAAQETGVYQATLQIANSGGATAEFIDRTAQAVQVVKNEKKKTTTVLAVPFAKGLDGETVTIDSLIDVSSLSNGDKIKQYNKQTGNYDVWTYKDDATQKGWFGQVTEGEDGQTQAPQASEVTIDAGKALIFERATTDKPIVMVGQYDDSAEVSTPIERPTGTGSDTNAVWNLVGNVEPEKPYDINKIETTSDADIVVMPTEAGLPKRYHPTLVDSKRVWAFTTNYVDEVYVGGRLRKVTKSQTVTNATVEAGGWFWYVSDGTDGTDEIKWKQNEKGGVK